MKSSVLVASTSELRNLLKWRLKNVRSEDLSGEEGARYADCKFNIGDREGA